MKSIACFVLTVLLLCVYVSPPVAAQNIDPQFLLPVEQINDPGFSVPIEQINDPGFYASANIPPGAINYAITPINVPDKPVLPIGVSETRDVAALFFKFYETYLKASADGEVNFSDVPHLLGPAMLLIPAFSGASQITSELANLTDEQIKVLLLVADEYELGNHAQRAKQVFKTVLTLAQTYFVFNKTNPSP